MLMLCGTPLSSYIPLDRRFLLDFHRFPPPPSLSLSPVPSFHLKTVFGLSRIHKIQLSFFLPSLLPTRLYEQTRSRLDSTRLDSPLLSLPLLACSIMTRLTDTRAAKYEAEGSEGRTDEVTLAKGATMLFILRPSHRFLSTRSVDEN